MTGLRHGPLLRPRDAQARVTNVELFFDLVFAFAVTQLSHRLLGDLSPAGTGETLLLFMATWWVWMYTAWCTNWIDPDRTPVRLMLFTIMLVGTLFSAALPDAFGPMGTIFAGSYVAIQICRSAFMLWAIGDRSPANRRNFQRITLWLAASGLFWLWGAAEAGETRLAFWVSALAIDYVSPAAGFYVPGLGCSSTTDWDIEGGHLAERCSQFIIIALGESVLVTGAKFATLVWDLQTAAAFAAAFVGSVALWWIYFDTAVERGSRHIATLADPGRLARFAYTYVHMPIVAGIVVEAVGDDLVLAHPTRAATPPQLAILLAGPAIYLVGNIMFKAPIAGRTPLSHLVGLVLLAALATVAGRMDLLELGAATTAVLVVVAVWETRSLRRSR